MSTKARDLYLLADGTYANPADCEPDADGALRHIYGMPVAMTEDGKPQTVRQGAVDNKNVEAAEAGEVAAAEAERKATDNARALKDEAANTAPAELGVDVTTGQPTAEVAPEPALAPEPAPVAPESFVPPTAKPKSLRPAKAKTYKTREVKGH